MESITSAELIELVLLQREAFDTQFQFWITATFAVIVASFAAGRRLSAKYRWVVALLYMLTTFMIFARWVHDAREMGLLLSEIQQRGIPYTGPRVFAATKAVLMIFGTVTALVFLRQDSKSDRDSDT
jgi:hypothetical protein